MKTLLAALIRDALATVDPGAALDTATIVDSLGPARAKAHGDLSSTVGFLLAKRHGGSPREWANRISAALATTKEVRSVEVAGAGFINFFLNPALAQEMVRKVLREGDAFGRAPPASLPRIHLEFVSANPNGPLHVGHGRGAAFGDSLARVLTAGGHTIHREYYVNDAGRQMDILAVSVWARYLESHGAPGPFPENGYHGEYVRGIAAALGTRVGSSLCVAREEVQRGLPPDADAGGDKDTYVDALVVRARALLGDERYEVLHAFGRTAMLDVIREDLAEFGVAYDEWYSERSLLDTGAVAEALARLEAEGHAYRAQGALWFRTTAFGDEKDRVLVRENGVPTYFATDIAYHLNKLARGYHHCIDVWGADHHGHVPRVMAALKAFGQDPQQLEIRLVQFAALYRGDIKVQMSTRSGDFVTLRELREEVGNDAARFFYVMRTNEQTLDFDLELAKSQSTDNPVYYVQYAHARIASVRRTFAERGLAGVDSEADLSGLTAPEEEALLTQIGRFPERVARAAEQREPHQIAYYLRELATQLHAYYNAQSFLAAEPAVRPARLALLAATQQVLRNGLTLLGVTSPERM